MEQSKEYFEVPEAGSIMSYPVNLFISFGPYLDGRHGRMVKFRYMNEEIFIGEEEVIIIALTNLELLAKLTLAGRPYIDGL